jgi:cytoskeletal protein RodZ
MSELDTECPRCHGQGLPEALPPVSPPEPLPAAPLKAEPKGVGVLEVPGKHDTRWALIALGAAIVLLLAVIIWLLLRPAHGTQVAQAPTQQATPATTEGQAVAAAPQAPTQPATTAAQALPQAPAAPTTPAGTAQPSLAAGTQAPTQPATSDAGSVAAGKDDAPCDTTSVRAWTVVQTLTGKAGHSEYQLAVQCPWRVELYTGDAVASDLGIDQFVVDETNPKVAMGMPFAIASKYHPRETGMGTGWSSGTIGLGVESAFDNWTIWVEEGQY